jgi:hypothetical protein
VAVDDLAQERTALSTAYLEGRLRTDGLKDRTGMLYGIIVLQLSLMLEGNSF